MLDIAVLGLVGGLVLLAGVSVIGIFDKVGAKSKLYAALQPYLFKAVIAGDKLAEKALDEVQTELTGADKKAVADSVYDLIPAYLPIPGIPYPLPVKMLVSREEFEALVENAYREVGTFVAQYEDHFKAQVNAFVNKPAGTPPTTAG